jgi:PAS domain S-box-containing protein
MKEVFVSRILVVDDNEQNCYFLETLLKGHGYEVAVAVNGAEALELAKAEDFDLILSDILMPVMDGFALCRAWKLDNRLTRIPFVFYTATYTEPKEEQFAMSLGADRFLLKPQPPEVLLIVIQEMVSRKLAHAPGPTPLTDEITFIQQHHTTLFQKLEKKLLDIEYLQSANARFGKILAASLNEIFVFDGITLLFSFVNQGALDHLGYAESEMKKLTPMDICPEFTADRFNGILQSLRNASQEKLIFETWQQKKDGSNYPVEFHLEPILDDRELSFLAIVQDITQRKQQECEHRRLQAEIHHAQKLESLGRMASSVAHDMNNMLTAILGLVGTLQERYGDDTHLTKKLGTILKATERGQELIGGLTEFARKDIQEPQDVDLNALVLGDIDLLQHSCNPSIQWELDLADALPHVLGDPSALSRVVINLCKNALDAMPLGGILKVQTRALENERMELIVEDTGQGIPPEVLARVLEPFFTTKPRGKGTGLGLAIVDSIVRSHSGMVKIQSEVGKGTSIHVHLPLH